MNLGQSIKSIYSLIFVIYYENGVNPTIKYMHLYSAIIEWRAQIIKYNNFQYQLKCTINDHRFSRSVRKVNTLYPNIFRCQLKIIQSHSKRFKPFLMRQERRRELKLFMLLTFCTITLNVLYASESRSQRRKGK